MSEAPGAPADRLREYAAQAIEFVRRAVGLELDFDSDTLPLLDHYLRSVPTEQPATVELVVTTAGAYFGEVVVRRLGGRWETPGDRFADWRVVLPTGVSFSPAAFVGAAILRAEPGDLDTALEAPPRMRPYLEQALARMSPTSEDEFYSLGGRLDTLEHVHEVLVAVAAQMMGDAGGDDAPDQADEPDEPDEPAPPPAKPVLN